MAKTTGQRSKHHGTLELRGKVYRARWEYHGRVFTRSTRTGNRREVIQAMFSWFLGAEEQSVIDGLVRTASKIATQILKSVIEKQKRNAGKFIEKCLKQQQRRLGHPRFPTAPSAETATAENTQPNATTTVNQL